MINFTSRTQYYLCPNPTDMRNGRNGLAGIIRELMGEDPYDYDRRTSSTRKTAGR